MKILHDLMAPAKSEPKKIISKHLQRAAIQGKLMCLRGESIFADSLRDNAVKDLNSCLRMILDQAGDEGSRPWLIKIIGEPLLKEIESL